MPHKRNVPHICEQCGVPFLGIVTSRFCSKGCATGWRNHESPKPRTPWEHRFWAKIEKGDSCWLHTGAPGPFGYGDFNIDPRGLHMPFHRAAWLLATGEEPNGPVCHTCDAPACVRNDEVGTYIVQGIAYPRRGHLWLGTQTANIADMWTKGRGSSIHHRIGEQHPNARLTDADVATIKRLIEAGVVKRRIAEQFSVDPCTVTDIAKGRTWKHVIS
jgi:hypothetical protein